MSNKGNLKVPLAPEIRWAKPLVRAKRTNCIQFVGLSPDRGFRARSPLPTPRNAPRSAAFAQALRCFWRSLVRRLHCRPSIGLAVLTFFAFSPFVSFAVYLDESMSSSLLNVTLYQWKGSGSNPTYDMRSVTYDCRSFDSAFSIFASSPFGFRTSRTGLFSISPSSPTSTNITSTSSSYERCLCFTGYKYANPRLIRDIDSLYSLGFSLASQGYSGSGLVLAYQDNNYFYWNLDYKMLIADILSSTNTVFRQILISHLSGISSSVQNIDVNVSGLQSTIQQGNDDIVDALIGDYPELQEELRKGNSRAVDVRTSIKSQLQAWRNEAKKQLQDWKTDLEKDLQDWKTSDETGYLNVRQSVNDVAAAVDSLKNQFSTFDPRLGTNVQYTAFVTNFVTAPVTNSVQQSSSAIQSNATANTNRQIDNSQSIWDDFRRAAIDDGGSGLNVKIQYPLWEKDGYHVNVRDDAVVQAIQDGITIVNPDLTDIRDSWDSFLGMYSKTNSLDWIPWFEKWVPFSEVVTNYYAEFNASVPASDIASDFLERGFDSERYSALPWFERVEVLLSMIADVRSNSVDTADIQAEMETQAVNFQALSTNVVAASSDVVGLFQYVRHFSSSLHSVFVDRAAPLTGEYVLLPAGHWIGDTPLVLRVNPDIQNLCRLIMQCIWFLGLLVLFWLIVNWCWSKVVAVLRWLWSMFDV